MDRSVVARAYFLSERRGAALLLVLGAASLGLAVRLWPVGAAARWAAAVLAVFGLPELLAGAAVLARAPRQAREAAAGLADAGGAWLGRERRRMARVLRSLKIYAVAEAALLTLGVLLAIEGGAAGKAVGFALAAEAMLLLGFDGVARRRALAYAAAIGA